MTVKSCNQHGNSFLVTLFGTTAGKSAGFLKAQNKQLTLYFWNEEDIPVGTPVYYKEESRDETGRITSIILSPEMDFSDTMLFKVRYEDIEVLEEDGTPGTRTLKKLYPAE